jgi:hypothetical protein
MVTGRTRSDYARAMNKQIIGPHLVYGFLTTSPNAVVKPTSESDAGDPDRRRGTRRVEAGAVE